MLGTTAAAVGRGAGAGRCAATGAAPVLVGAATDDFVGAAAAGAGVKAGLGAPVGPPGGNVGSLMVGAAVGFGGKLIRTVSFLGCTLPVDFFNGSAPVGVPGNGLFGGMSAILIEDKRRGAAVKFNSFRPCQNFTPPRSFSSQVLT